MDKKLLGVERDIVGDIWQSGEMRENHYYMADEIGSRFAGTESEKKAIEHMVKTLKEYGYENAHADPCLLYTSPSPRDRQKSRMPSSA